MLSGKTRQGVSIKSTQGMRPMHSPETWMLVADRSRVRLFKERHDELGTSIDLIFDSPNPDGRKHGRDLVTDRPGRAFEGRGDARHAYGNSFQPQDAVTEKLVRQTTEFIQDLRLKEGTELILIAESQLLGMLRSALAKQAPQLSIACHEKDFAWLKNGELEQRLRALIE